jgi:hypothetical protein
VLLQQQEEQGRQQVGRQAELPGALLQGALVV